MRLPSLLSPILACGMLFGFGLAWLWHGQAGSRTLLLTFDDLGLLPVLGVSRHDDLF